MKEKIREILTIKRGVVYGDFPGLIADLEHLVNQEVEKRIAERMPSRDCENRELDRRKRYDEAMGYTFNEIKSLEKGIKFGMRFYKRLLTNSSQKTEGGER